MFITKKEIRKQLYVEFKGAPKLEEKIQEVYNWITDAPFWQWKDRLWCASISGCWKSHSALTLLAKQDCSPWP